MIISIHDCYSMRGSWRRWTQPDKGTTKQGRSSQHWMLSGLLMHGLKRNHFIKTVHDMPKVGWGIHQGGLPPGVEEQNTRCADGPPELPRSVLLIFKKSKMAFQWSERIITLKRQFVFLWLEKNPKQLPTPWRFGVIVVERWVQMI